MTQYELEAPWQPIETVPMNVGVNVLYASGRHNCLHFYTRVDIAGIAWCPIVPPKVKRWRAEYNGEFFYVNSYGVTDRGNDVGYSWQDTMYAIGNYYRTREEAEAAAVRVKKAYVGGCNE